MRKLILTATGFVCLAGGTYFMTAAWGQESSKARKEAPAADDAPHRIGVVDIDFIFENYTKVKVELEELKAEVQQTEEKLKAMQRNGQELFEEFKTLKEGTPERKAKEEKLTMLQAQWDAKRKSAGNELKREQAKMQLTIYQEIQDAVKVVANHNSITLVVKASRNEAGSMNDPQRTQIMMNQACIFHRKQDDMTDTVLKLLNNKYLRDNPEAAAKTETPKEKEPVRPVSGEKKPGASNRVKTADGTKRAAE